MTDYYGALGLNKSSSVADITASFRKLALKVSTIRQSTAHCCSLCG